MKENIIEIQDKSALLEKVTYFKNNGYRLVQICASTFSTFELTYSFAKEKEIKHIRLQLPKENPTLPSITEVYFAAFTYENELHDLFGIKVEGNKLDFGGNFYKLSKKAPFSEVPSKVETK